MEGIMNDDILKPVRDKIIKEDEKCLPWVPKSLDKTWEYQAGVATAIAGFFAGLTLGAHIGIATGGTAIAGTIPLAITGAVIGYFSGAKIGSHIHRPISFDNSSTLKYLESSDDQPKAITDE
jgi:hypothetical protein